MPTPRPKRLPIPSSLKRNGSPWRGFLIYGILAILALFFFYSFAQPIRMSVETPLSQVLADVREQKVAKIEVDGAKLLVTYKDEKTVTSRKEEGEVLNDTFKAANIDPTSVEVTIKDRTFSQAWLAILTT